MGHRRGDGYQTIADVFAPDEVASLLAALEGIPRTRAGARHLMSDPRVASLAGDRRLLDLASHALGVTARPFSATLFDKSPGANWLVSWHQDTALPVRERRDVAGWGPWSMKDGVLYAHAPASALWRVVALRVHLDDSMSGNGPLRVVPGSHADGILDGAAIGDVVRRCDRHECTVGRGGIVVMRPLIVHASSKAILPAPRRVLHLAYASGLDVAPGVTLAMA